jgi:small subunit ribosomal protein S5
VADQKNPNQSETKPNSAPHGAAGSHGANSGAGDAGQRAYGDGAGQRGNKKGKKPVRRRQKAQEGEFIEKVVSVNRTAKVVQGGKNFSFAALVVVGNGKGRIGYSVGKAKEVQDAIQKGLTHAKARMVDIKLTGVTIAHEMTADYGAAKVFMKPAAPGTGVIAGAAVRAVCECVGIKDILTKSLGSQTPLNVVHATMGGLRTMLGQNHS